MEHFHAEALKEDAKVSNGPTNLGRLKIDRRACTVCKCRFTIHNEFTIYVSYVKVMDALVLNSPTCYFDQSLMAHIYTIDRTILSV